jgi:hypothetical protein
LHLADISLFCGDDNCGPYRWLFNFADIPYFCQINKGNRVPKAIGKYRMPSEHKWTDVKIPVEWQ